MKNNEYRFKLLKPQTVQALKDGGLPYILIQFFDQLSGAAKALNGSKNPMKAASTMLENPDDLKPGRKLTYNQMIEAFMRRRVKINESIVYIPPTTQKLLDSFHGEDLTPPLQPEEEIVEEEIKENEDE